MQTTLLGYIPAVISRAEAHERAKKFLERLRDRVGLRNTPPRYEETVYLPYYCFPIGKDRSFRADTVLLLVDGWGGMETLVTGLPAVAPHAPCAAVFAPNISPPEAQQIAADACRRALLRRVILRATDTAPPTASLRRISLLYWPYHVLYFEKKRKVTVRIIDAYRGETVGARLTATFLQAFVAQARNR
jgi:hypothetical protein